MEFLEPFVNLADHRTARHRHNDRVRRSPSQLFSHFIADCFRAFRVERPEVHVHESPGIAIDNLAAQAVDRVVVALHGNQSRAVDLGRHDFALLEVIWNQNERWQPRGRGIRRHGVREVAGRGAAHGFQFEFERLVDCNCRHPILE